MKRLSVFILLILCLVGQLSANPYSGDVSLVIIDAGHGGGDPGAMANGLVEKDLTLSICQHLQSELEERGYETMMTREDDTFLELQERCDIANGADFDISGYPVFISIHINSAQSTSASGFEVYTRKADRRIAMLSPQTSDKLALKYSSYTNAQLNLYESTVSTRLAQYICNEFSQAFPSVPMRGVKSEEFWVLNATWMPSVLVEVGFISNATEADRMASASFQQDLAEAIADAVDSL